MSLTLEPINNGGLSSITLTSPETLDWTIRNGEKILRMSGTFFEATAALAHTKRDDSIEIINDLQRINIAYSGESGVDASYYVERVKIDTSNIGPGIYNYTLDALFIGATQV